MNYEELGREHIVTPANLLTLSRPLIGAEVGRRLLAGETDVTPLVLVMAATDAEGFIARLMDKHLPQLERGSTHNGQIWDPIADTVAFLEVSSAALKAPYVSKPAKLAVGIMLASEAVKATWATISNVKHRLKTGQQLDIRPGMLGKTATGFKFTAVALAVATNDLEPCQARRQLGIAAIGAALSGAVLGEKARRGYSALLQEES